MTRSVPIGPFLCNNHRFAALCFVALVCGWSEARAAVLLVGPQGYPSPCQAIAAARPDDTVEIESGRVWIDDFCTIQVPDLTVRSSGFGRAVLKGSAKLSAAPALWTVNAPGLRVEGIEFSKAQGAAGQGTAIQVNDGFGLSLRNCSFSGTHTSVITGGSPEPVVIENSQLAGLVSIGRVARLTVESSAGDGVRIESSAAETELLYNNLTNIRSIRLLRGEASAIGNVIHQAPDASGSLLRIETRILTAVNNTFVRDTADGAFVAAGAPVAAVVLKNNIFAGPGPLTDYATPAAVGNFVGDPQFAEPRSHDYHLTPQSPAIDAGIDPGSSKPLWQYRHPLCAETRTSVGAIDIGAYEYGGGGGTCAGQLSGRDVTKQRSPASRHRTEAAINAGPAFAASPVVLALASGTASPGGSVSLDLSLGGSTAPAGLMWSFVYPASIKSLNVAVGPSAASAAKNLTCNNSFGSTTCVLIGLNSNNMGNGVVARATVHLDSSALGFASIQVSSPIGTTAEGEPLGAIGSPGTVAVRTTGECRFELTSAGTIVDAGGGLGTLSIDTSPGCSWTAVSHSPWVELDITEGTGSGSVTFTSVGNPSVLLPRTGSLLVAGQVIQLLQKASTTPGLFQDVAPGDWFFDSVTLLGINGITVGCSQNPPLYCPGAPVSRDQMAAFLVRSIVGDSFSYSTAPYFEDVPPDHIFFRYIQKLKELGVTVGCTPTRYCPQDVVTRGQMAAFLVRGRLGIQSFDPFPYPANPFFTDIRVGDDFYPYVQKLRELGITAGCTPTEYCPGNPTTRDQMAVFLIRAFRTP